MTSVKLNNAPVAAAIFQIVFNEKCANLSDFDAYDTNIKRVLPIKSQNINVGINLQETQIQLGKSNIAANAAINAYTYTSNDQKVKLEIFDNRITYINEQQYTGWNDFTNNISSLLAIIEPLISKSEISRMSIRFINRFQFDGFDNPQEYFRLLVSSTEESNNLYPINSYGFRLNLDIPESDIRAIVKQNVNSVSNNLYIYNLDIDVIDHQHIFYDINTIKENLQKIRTVKNNIFFDSITEKTIQLCN